MSDPPKSSGTPGAEEGLMASRRAKADKLRERGESPFANDVVARIGGRTCDISEARALAREARDASGRYEDGAVRRVTGGAVLHVRGRIIAFRSAGGITFLRLRDRTDELQLLLTRERLGDGHERLGELDVGDIVEAEGQLMASRRGELSIEVLRWRLLTKAYRPLPEKWHGLTDVELRYRQRYVDLIANPSVADVFRARALVLKALRALLDQEGFVEVETPSLHPLIGGAAARPFETHHHTLDMHLFLRIAPELYLKRLLVGGLERVYEIGRCYRNEGISTKHNPEFTMLEFYRAYATYDDLMTFTESILRAVDTYLAQSMPEVSALWRSARPFALEEPFVRLSMDRAVAAASEKTAIPEWAEVAEAGGGRVLAAHLGKGIGERIKEWSRLSPRAKEIDWSNFRAALGKCENDGERLFACYEYLAEPFLDEDYRTADGVRSVPVFVKDYPVEVSPLARKNDANPDLADRFELFVHGRELCNAFSELNDPDDQAARFRAQTARKARGDQEAMDYDEDYIRALEHGMPPAAGFGMGIDRLVMMLTNSPSIRDVILFPLLRPER